MSEYYTFSLTYDLRRDTPAALLAALAALAARQLPAETDLAALPPLIADHFRHPRPCDGSNGGCYPVQFSTTNWHLQQNLPDDPVYYFCMEVGFSDDAWGNGGVFFILWLFQFAAEDGHLATKRKLLDCPPELYTKHGEDILITSLAYNPLEACGLRRRKTPLDPDEPIIAEKTHRENLRQLLDTLRYLGDYA